MLEQEIQSTETFGVQSERIDSTRREVEKLASEWADCRAERQRRRELDPVDFNRLFESGFLLSGVPVEYGGIWDGVCRTTRPVCELLRALAKADSSVALVCAMHPTVLSFWLATPDVAEPFRESWHQQRRAMFSSVLQGTWWGTITSEPGSGGDIAQTRAVATRTSSGYQLVGDKGFGSGSGVTDYMMTVAIQRGRRGRSSRTCFIWMFAVPPGMGPPPCGW